MSMKFFTGLQDFLGLYTSSTQAISTPPTSSTRVTSSLFPPVTNSRHSSNPKRRSLASVNREELGDEQVRRCSHNRSVHFPDDDAALISGYHEAPCNAFHLQQSHTVSNITDAYRSACERQHITPNETVERQIACFHQINGLRQECLSLKGQRLSQAHMECLEEIMKRVQFDTLDFEYTFIDDDAAVSLAEMLEFYDSTVNLNLSFNKQINIRGWQALFRAIKNCQSLQVLNLRYTSLSERAVPVLTRTLRTQPSLTVLHIENVSLSGKSLLLLVCALKSNTILKELYLGENNLQPSDGVHLHQLIVGNSSIQMLDLRNNQLQDSGASHIFDALRHKDVLENSALSALVMWNNRMTSKSMEPLARALLENNKLETLNIGSNNLSVDGISALKPALLANTTLQRLGLQATNLDCQCAIVLAECIADNKVLVRVDLRDNSQIGSAGLLALHLAMRMNTSITLLNLDYTCANTSSAKVKEYNEEFRKYFNEIKEFCERNKKLALDKLTVHSEVVKETEETEEPVMDGNANEEVGEVKKTVENGAAPEEAKVKERLTVERPAIPKQSSFDLSAPHRRPVFKLTRSSSLTCAELVEDISERIVQMSRSLTSLTALDENVLDVEPAPVANKLALSTEPSTSFASATAPKTEMVKSPSLPILSKMDLGMDSTATIKRKPRRFSVSAASISMSNPDIYRSVSPRFKVEKVVLPTPAATVPTITAPAANDLRLNDLKSTTTANNFEMQNGTNAQELENPKKDSGTVPSASTSEALTNAETERQEPNGHPLPSVKLEQPKIVLANGFPPDFMLDERKMKSGAPERNGYLISDYAGTKPDEEEFFPNHIDANSNETSSDASRLGFTILTNDRTLEHAVGITEFDKFSVRKENGVNLALSTLMETPSTSSVKIRPTMKLDCKFVQAPAEQSPELSSSRVSSKAVEEFDQTADLCEHPSREDVPSCNDIVILEEHIVSAKICDHSCSSSTAPVVTARNTARFCEHLASDCVPSTSSAADSDEEVVREIVKDLVNYTVYELGEEEYAKIIPKAAPAPVTSFGGIASGMSHALLSTTCYENMPVGADGECDDTDIVRSVVRGLVRDVLFREKEVLQGNLRRKRERLQKGIPREFT